MKKHSPVYYLVTLAAVAILTAADQWTKYLAVIGLKDKPSKVLIPGVLELSYVENRGMAFSLMQDQRLFFLITTGIILAALVYILIRIPAEKKFLPLNLCIVFIMAGAIGNLIDRARLGYVVDFVYISLINFPVFNVADVFVTWTAVVAGILITFYYKEEDLKQIRLL